MSDHLQRRRLCITGQLLIFKTYKELTVLMWKKLKMDESIKMCSVSLTQTHSKIVTTSMSSSEWVVDKNVVCIWFYPMFYRKGSLAFVEKMNLNNVSLHGMRQMKRCCCVILTHVWNLNFQNPKKQKIKCLPCGWRIGDVKACKSYIFRWIISVGSKWCVKLICSI